MICEAQGGFVSRLFVVLLGFSRISSPLRTLGRSMPYAVLTDVQVPEATVGSNSAYWTLGPLVQLRTAFRRTG